MLVSIPTSANPLYVRISDGIKDAILSGKLASGSKLPSTRALAADLEVSRNTVALAYEQLAAEGYLVGHNRSAPSVAPVEVKEKSRGSAATSKSSVRLSPFGRRLSGTTQKRRPVLHPHLRYDFRYGQPAVGDFPREVWRKFLSSKAVLSSELAGYGPPAGHVPLRRALKNYLGRARGISCELEQIVIVSGSQQAFDLVARLLVDENCRVIVEEPHYPGSAAPFAAAGARMLRLPIDENGLDINLLRSRKQDVRAICVTPCHQFPTGVVMPLTRRTALLEWASVSDAWIIEDDYASELRYVGRPIEALKALDRNDRVIHVGTFSKTLLPALRLAYVVLPHALIGPFLAAKALSDRYTSVFGQDVLAHLIETGHFERFLRRACARNSLRRQALVSSLDRHFKDRVICSGENAGVHLLVSFRDRTSEDVNEMISKASRSGVGLYFAAPFYDKRPRDAKFLFGYAALSEAQIRRGIERLASVLN